MTLFLSVHISAYNKIKDIHMRLASIIRLNIMFVLMCMRLVLVTLLALMVMRRVILLLMIVLMHMSRFLIYLLV